MALPLTSSLRPGDLLELPPSGSSCSPFDRIPFNFKASVPCIDVVDRRWHSGFSLEPVEDIKWYLLSYYIDF